jgi:hypothetical protein
MTKALILSTMAMFVHIGAANAQYYNYGSGSNSNDHYVSGYTNSHGTYIQPHYQTNPDGNSHNNFGAYGNYNPHNGRTGTGY